MAKFKKIKARWHTEAQTKAIEMGIEVDSSQFVYNELWIDLDKIAVIEESDDHYCIIRFSMLDDDAIITDIPYKNVDKLIKEIE